MMTWKEFKTHVEKLMKEQGITEDAKLWNVSAFRPDARALRVQKSYHVPEREQFTIFIRDE